MYVRFNCLAGSSNGYGFKGFVEGITAAATATAGSTPTKPAGVDEWYVIGNEEAGGWTVESSSYSNSTMNFDIELSAPTSISGKSKRIKFEDATTNTSYLNLIRPRISFYEGTTALVNNQTMFGLFNSVTGVENGNRGFYHAGLNPGYASAAGMWHVSCTADYFWIWFETPGGASDTSHQSNYCGVADLDGIPSDVSNVFPAVGMLTENENSTYFMNNATSQYFNERVLSYAGYFYNGSPQDQSFRSNYHSYNNENDLDYGTNQPFKRNGPPYSYTNTNLDNHFIQINPMFSHGYNSTLYPTVLTQMPSGVQYATVKGAAYYAFEKHTSAQGMSYYRMVTEGNKLIYDSTGTRWTIQQFGPYKSSHFLKAFRAV